MLHRGTKVRPRLHNPPCKLIPNPAQVVDNVGAIAKEMDVVLGVADARNGLVHPIVEAV